MKFGIMFANTGHGASPEGASAVGAEEFDFRRPPISPLFPRSDPTLLAEIGETLNATYASA